MKDELNYIDELYKKSFDGYKVEAGNESWEKLKWALFWMRHKWLIGLGSIIIVLGLGWLAMFSLTNNSSFQNEIADAEQNLEFVSTKTQNEQNNEITVLKEYGNPINEVSEIFIEQQESSLNGLSTSFESTIENPVLIGNNESIVFSKNYSNSFVFPEEASLTAINSLGLETIITTEPDSNLLGYNLRNDALAPGLRKQWLSLNIYAGPSFSGSVISGYELEPEAWKNSNESNKFGWSIGTDLRFHIKNWIITTGLNYSVYNQNQTYSHTFKEYSPDNSYFDYDTTWVWIFDAPDFGKPRVKTIDSSWVEVYDDVTISKSGLDQLKYFEIPLLVGYRFNGNMFAIELNTGVSAGFLVYSSIIKIPVLTNNLQTVDASQMNKSIINFIANASIYYHVNKKTSLFVSPYYKQNLRSLFKETYPVKQQFKTIGVNFGVNILF